jgi:hypothetical protein
MTGVGAGAGSGSATTATGAGTDSGADVTTGGGAGAAVSEGGGAAGLAVFTSRGAGITGAAGFGGSGARPAGFFAPPARAAAGVSANDALEGTLIPRCRARRETNSLATTSSIVLDALFTSMPWSRFSSAITSWLVVLRSSATL